MNAARQLTPAVGTREACDALGVSRATFYRHDCADRHGEPPQTAPPLRPSPRRLTDEQRSKVLGSLHEPRFADKAPAEVYATLLDEDTYLCSERTMYRILAESKEVRDRRNQLRHPAYAKPELLATAPNQVWSWDITKLKGPVKWTYYYLYVIMDIFSRYVVGWMLAHRETAMLAKRLIATTCENQLIEPGQLVIHADRGSPMKSKAVAHLMADLGVTKSHNRPHVSNDNPYSESQFKTLKYRPDFPARFGCYPDADAHCHTFFGWYNIEHRHAGIGLLTPQAVHYGHAPAIHKQRQLTLDLAHQRHPERFVRGRPMPPPLPHDVWINKPTNAHSPDLIRA